MLSSKQKYENSNKKGEITKPTPKGLMYISSPREIVEIINKIPFGKILTVADIANKLAKKHKVDFTCPLTTGIFVSIIANYANDEKLDIPYWRVIKTNDELYDHYFKQDSNQVEILRQEGHKVVHDDKKNTNFVEIKK